MTSAQPYFDLGQYQLDVATSSDDAQVWCNRGLNWLYGFNHEEAVVCFEAAAEADPDCLMAHWGVAFAIGPNYNKAWDMFGYEEKKATLAAAHAALERGAKLVSAGAGKAVERALLSALQTRYPTAAEVEDFGPFNDAFADAMRSVHKDYPDHLAVTCLFVEAIMGRTPWQLWDLVSGEVADGASTAEARQVLEHTFAEQPEAWSHPGLLHMYIHLMEMSPTPELALPHGDHLVDLVPASGHLIHMATHIDVLCGEYQNVIYRNHRAAAVDRSFTDLRGAQNFYTVYRIHNVHFEAYGAMFLARKNTALAAASQLQVLLPEAPVAYMPDFFEAFWGMKLHVMVRFGMWQDILDEPLPADAELFSFTTALLRYGRVVALANLGQHAAAADEFQQFRAAQAAVQETRSMFNNTAAEVLCIAAEMAEGELKYKSGEVEAGLTHLRQAAYLSDHLTYDEPWGWMQPPRHALAALLMDQRQYEEAEATYRADLGLDDTLPRACQHPRNVWSLHGLHECLAKRGEQIEIVHVKQKLDLALSRAEVPIHSSCYCRTA